ncbi:SDR family NAD(P)-dependent oxidoreductase [Bacteroidota bacterium]
MSKKIAITGASSDIGKAIITKMKNNQFHFIIHTTSKETGFQEFLMNLGIQFDIYVADFTKPDQLANFCSELKENDVLINVAGSTKTDLLPMLTDDDINTMIDVNIRALIKICQAAIPYMSSKRRGCIVNISSIAASKGNRGQTVYAGTKGFVESFSRSLAAEYGSRGIRVNCVAPGAINAGSLKQILNYAPEEIKNNLLSKRLGTPNDVANLTVFLCSEEAGFINGQVIKTDGGYLKGLT